MDRSVTQALIGLVPSLSDPLPPELVELAGSLLAQSRSKASSLKADEEIARSYACANIACERLKQTLALPKIQPRPPCPPKVYQKLYQYLDSALPPRERRSSRIARSNGKESTPTFSPVKPRTPSRSAHIRPDTPGRKTPQRLAVGPSETPQWVMPVIRQLCQKMGAPAAPHHVFAGVSSILSTQKMTFSSKTKAQSSAIKTPALIVAVYVWVTARLAWSEKPAIEYQQQRNSAVNIFESLAQLPHEMRSFDHEDVDTCMRQIKEHQWTEMDWFENIPVGTGLGLSDSREVQAESEDGLAETEEEQLLPVQQRIVSKNGATDPDYLQAGLGTMMQDRVDYLSDDRRREYKEWKKSILLQIAELEKGQEMDVEAG
ncbi:hypothetical protein N7G274_003004 [Stereocaulon virgatum]|uniref:ORC6 first cyclin-like domain-containing protein n=1 Tax=Stereocaulon virgatum TaxID=373712 RepID=A0ABR4AHV5_9LECA